MDQAARSFNVKVARDMQRVALCAWCISGAVVLCALDAPQPWSVIGGFCAGFLAVFATCYAVVGARIIREMGNGEEI